MNLFRPTYTKPRPYDQAPVTRTSEVWWVKFTVKGRHFRMSTEMRDKSAAIVVAASLVREEELKAAGINTHARTTRVPLGGLVDEYLAEMVRLKRAAKHVETTRARLRAMTQGLASVADVTPVAVRLGLDRIRGASAKTVNAYRAALGTFFEWLIAEGRWADNPVKIVGKATEFGGRKRRAFTADEQRRLLNLRSSEFRLTYVIALNTGLRRAEINALQHADFTERDGRAYVRVRSGTAKNRIEDVLPLPQGFVRPTIFITPTMVEFRRDLKAAGISAADVDFHSLRRSFATNLALAGVPLVVAQRMMRHADPALTANIYTTVRLDDEEAAVDRANPDQYDHGRSKALAFGGIYDTGPGTFALDGVGPPQQEINGCGNDR